MKLEKILNMKKSKPMKLTTIFSLIILIISQTAFTQTSIQDFAPKPPL